MSIVYSLKSQIIEKHTMSSMIIFLLQRKTEMIRWKKREVLKDLYQNVSIISR